ncbi:MAG: hypothetical protein V4472_11905 [Pseudomonadota bacterium]
MARMGISLLVIAGGLVTAALGTASGAAGGSETINYTYDAKGRLVLVQHSGTVNNNVVANYTFDAVDNRRNLKVTGAP